MDNNLMVLDRDCKARHERILLSFEKINAHNVQQDKDILQNTLFRKSMEKLMWLVIGVLVSGFGAMILAILSLKSA